MQFTLLVTASPYQSYSAKDALDFALNALTMGHSIHTVFFQGEGTHCGNTLLLPGQDEINLVEAWSTLGSEHDIKLIACISSAIRRGIFDEAESQRYDKACANLAPQFQLGGLGDLIQRVNESEKLITFK